MDYPIDEASLHHQIKSPWCCLVAEQTLALSLRTKAGDVERVELVSFPRYGAVEYPLRTIEAVLRDEAYDYYQIVLRDIPVKRFGYYFVLHKHRKRYAYTELGLFVLELVQVEEGLPKYCFHYPYFHDLHIVPEWAKGAIAYEIFPDRFARSSQREQTEPDLPAWESLPNEDEDPEQWQSRYFGGDLQGIIERIGYLEKLGIEILYLTPIFAAHSNHKYDTIDYKKIDPCFGTNEDFRELVRACHQRGIKVILDAVFNHVGPGFAPFADVVAKGAESAYAGWFHILEFPVPHYTTLLKQIESGARKAMHDDGRTALPYETFAHTPMMPKLNTANAEAKAYLLDVATYWIREYGIDGWRLDVANEVDAEFWREFRRCVLAAKSDALIIGEIWHDAHAWLQGDQFDGVMNYPFQDISFGFFLDKNMDAPQAQKLLNALLLRNTPQVNQVQWNMLDSHDTPRLIRKCDGDEQKAILLLGFMLTYIGMPLLYYGTELGLDGADDPDCRRCMPWNPNSWNQNIYRAVRRLMELRKQYAVLRSGALRWLPAAKGRAHTELLCFERFDPQGKEPSRTVLFNRCGKALPTERLQNGECVQKAERTAPKPGQIDLLSGEIFSGVAAPYRMYVL